MGCCKSSSNNDSVVPSSDITNENMLFERILSSIPVHDQEQLRNLPMQRFLSVYKYHLIACVYLTEKDYLLALFNERIAIQELKLMLPHHEHHFIFILMYQVLCECFWEIGNMERFAEIGETIVAIMLKHTPIDYAKISIQYHRSAQAYLVREKWRETEQCIMKAIEAGQLSDESMQVFVRALEECLIVVRQNMNNGSKLQPINHFLKSNPGESIQDFLHRAPAEMMPIYNEIESLGIDKAEYERLPDKQIESQINDEILNDVLKNLEKYLNEDTFLCKFGNQGGCASFIAAYFKATQMKTSSLSPALIEAALTIIIHRTNDENATDNDQYAAIKQSPFKISYIDHHKSQMTGVRVFETKATNPSEDNRIIVSMN